MTTAFTSPVKKTERLLILDAIRGIAVCGILLLNMWYFAMPRSAAFDLQVLNETSRADVWTWYLTNFLIDGSFRSLFSMLFGIGMVLLVTRLESREPGLQPADIYYRRLIWLLIFGLINAYVLLMAGDILYMYAVCGLFLFPFRKASPRLLLSIAAVFMVITMYKSWTQISTRLEVKEKGIAAFTLEKDKKPLTEEQQDDLKKWNAAQEDTKVEKRREAVKEQMKNMKNSYGVVWEEQKNFIRELESTYLYDSGFFDFMIFAMIGIAFFKLGIMTGERSKWLYFTFILVGYSIGFAQGIVRANLWRQAEFNFFTYFSLWPVHFSFYQFTRLLVTCGHIGVIMLLWNSRLFSGVFRLFANMGQMAFTNYLSQTLIYTFIFYGYGLNYFGEFSRSELWYFVVGGWIFQMIFSTIWLKYFLFGPFEWVWRSLTYWSVQPIVRKTSTGNVVIA